jgi:alpha-L-fucosidase 2
MAKPRWQMPFQTVGDLLVEFPGHGEVTEYRRELDIDGAIARVSYKAGGVRYTREYIASYPARVLAMRFTADRKGALSMAVRMRSPHSPVEVAGGADWITMAGPNGAARGIGGALKWEASARITAPRGRTAFRRSARHRGRRRGNGGNGHRHILRFLPRHVRRPGCT